MFLIMAFLRRKVMEIVTTLTNDQMNKILNIKKTLNNGADIIMELPVINNSEPRICAECNFGCAGNCVGDCTGSCNSTCVSTCKFMDI